MPHELFLTTRQIAKIRNVFATNSSSDINLSKAQLSKIIKSGETFDSWLGNLVKQVLTKVVIPLVRDNLLELVSNLTQNKINKFKRKKVEKELPEHGKDLLYWFRMKMLVILLKLEDSHVSIYGVNETMKEIKKVDLLAPLAPSLVQPLIYSVVKSIGGREVRGPGRWSFKQYRDY